MSISSRGSGIETYFSAPEDVTANSSIFMTGINVANTIIGVGIIGLPAVIRQFGILIGSILIMWCGFMTCTSCLLLVLCKKECRYTSVITIANHALGVPGDLMIKAAIILNNWGTL